MKNKLSNILITSVLAVSTVAMILGCGSSSTTTSKTETQQTQQTQQIQQPTSQPEPVQQKVERYKLGDTVQIDTEYGSFEICFTGVEETDYRNEFAEETPQKVILINCDYKNIDFSQTYYDGSVNNEISVNTYDISVYDSDGNILDTYPATLDYGKPVSPGHKGTCTMAYGLNSSDNYIEIEYKSSVWDSSATCIFDIEW